LSRVSAHRQSGTNAGNACLTAARKTKKQRGIALSYHTCGLESLRRHVWGSLSRPPPRRVGVACKQNTLKRRVVGLARRLQIAQLEAFKLPLCNPIRLSFERSP